MKNLARLATLGGALAIGAALVATPATAATTARSSILSTAVFVQTDDATGNSIVAYDRAADGTLTQAGACIRPAVSAECLTGAVVDHLASQGSLTYDRQLTRCTPSTRAATRSRCSPFAGTTFTRPRSSPPAAPSR